MRSRKQDQKIKERIIYLQKEFITQKNILDSFIERHVTKARILRAFDEELGTINGGIFQVAPIHVSKTIANEREQYDCSDLVVLNCETYDNSRDAECKLLLINAEERIEEIILKFMDDGKGIKELCEYLALGSGDKDRLSEAIGLAGQGAKLLLPSCIIYCITETKLKNGTTKALIWFLNHKNDKIFYKEIKPLGKITTISGTYVEVHLLKEALDYSPPNIVDELHSIYMKWYRTHLLENPGEVIINDEPVVAEQFPEAEKSMKFNRGTKKYPCKGELIITKDVQNELVTDQASDTGITLNIWGKDVENFSLEKGFGIVLEGDLRSKVTGYIKDNNLKQILKPNKEGILKDKPGCASVWQAFRKSKRDEIIKFLCDSGYYNPNVFSGKDAFTNRLNKDVRTIMKNDEGFKKQINEFKKIKVKITTGGGGTESGSKAIINLSTGPGKIIGRIVHSDETLEKGFSKTTNVDEFFKKGIESPSLLKNTDKASIKVYISIPGQKKMQHLVNLDRDIFGSDFVIDNVPLDVDLLVKAYTFYGNASHISEPLGRPTNYIRLTNSKLTEKAVLPINTKLAIKYVVRPEPTFEISIIGKENPQDPDDEDCIIVKEDHAEFTLHRLQGPRAEYVHVLTAIVYAVCSVMDGDEEFKKRRYKECLEKLLE